MLAAVGQLSGTLNQPLTPSPELIMQFVTGKINGRSFHQHLVNHAALNADYETFVTAFNATMARNDKTIAYAAALQANPSVNVGIISNTNDIHAAWLHRHMPELHLFSPVILSNEVGLRKPDAAIYRLALQQMAVQPQQAVFIDDLPENIAGAEDVGIHGILHADWATTLKAIEQYLPHKSGNSIKIA